MNSIAVIFGSIFENDRFYVNMRIDSRILPPPDIPLRNLPLAAL